MVNKIIVIFLLCCGVAYAEMNYLTIDDARDHKKIVTTINKMIGKLNQDKVDDRADKKEFRKAERYDLGCIDKMAAKMVNKGWIAQHSEIEP